jgi:release factor glutamine methyltransferase
MSVILEKHEIKTFLDNEPHLALFVEDNDALVFYKIAEIAEKNLAVDGRVF